MPSNHECNPEDIKFQEENNPEYPYIAPRQVNGVKVCNGCLRPLPKELISRREKDVVELAFLGHSNIAIGKKLGVSSKTVEAHKEHVKQRLGVHGMQQAFVVLLKEGLLNIEEIDIKSLPKKRDRTAEYKPKKVS